MSHATTRPTVIRFKSRYGIALRPIVEPVLLTSMGATVAEGPFRRLSVGCRARADA